MRISDDEKLQGDRTIRESIDRFGFTDSKPRQILRNINPEKEERRDRWWVGGATTVYCIMWLLSVICALFVPDDMPDLEEAPEDSKPAVRDEEEQLDLPSLEKRRLLQDA